MGNVTHFSINTAVMPEIVVYGKTNTESTYFLYLKIPISKYHFVSNEIANLLSVSAFFFQDYWQPLKVSQVKKQARQEF